MDGIPPSAGPRPLQPAQAASSWERRAGTSPARLWAERGGRQQAHDLLASIDGRFTEGFDTKDLQDAKARRRWAKLAEWPAPAA